MNITNITTAQLHHILAIRQEIENLEAQIASIEGGADEIPSPSTQPPRKGRRSAAVRAKMAAAQQARWARIKGTGAMESEPAKKGKRKLSPAHRRKLIKALAKARKIRWANAKAAKPAKKRDRRSSPATKAKLAAAARARWAKVRAEGKTRL
jgi:hypothetical protein